MVTRALTREERCIMNAALRDSLRIIHDGAAFVEDKKDGDLQDGMLAHYQQQAKASDVNVERRLEREPFDWRQMNR
jgi:hypothetical protein